jgi:hypothetical protein
MVCIRDIRYVILSTLFPSFMSNQAIKPVVEKVSSSVARHGHGLCGMATVRTAVREVRPVATRSYISS